MQSYKKAPNADAFEALTYDTDAICVHILCKITILQ